MERFIGRYPSHWWVFHAPWDLRRTELENARQMRLLDLIRRRLPWLAG
jgi:hypothetical protein